MTNSLSEEFRHRIDWIESQLNDMADEKGQVYRVDAEAMIFKHYRCSELAVKRYLRTLEGARIITQNSVFLVVEAKRPEKK